MTSTFDPVSLEIMWSRLINIAEECWITIWRTAFSLIIGEAQDFGCELFDPDAQSIAHSPGSMPVFNLTLPLAVRRLLEVFPRDTLDSMGAREIYEEGLQIPPLKLYRRGELNDDLAAMIRANVRLGHGARG